MKIKIFMYVGDGIKEKEIDVGDEIIIDGVFKISEEKRKHTLHLDKDVGGYRISNIKGDFNYDFYDKNEMIENNK